MSKDRFFLQNASTLAALQQANQLNAFRVKLADALRPLSDASEIQETAAHILGEALGATRVIYLEVVADGEEVIVHRNYTNGVAELSGRFSLEYYHRDLKADHKDGRTQVVTDISGSSHYTDEQKARYREIDIAAHIDVPLLKNNQFVALLAVHQSTPRQWTETEVSQVEETAERIWAAVERARAEALLQASHDTLQHLVENSPFGVYIVDADFRIAQVSAGAQKTFENVRPLIGHDFSEAMHILWPESFASEAIARFRHTLETGEPYHAPSLVEHRRDVGKVESYEWEIERIMLPDGRFGVVCHFYDMTERQRYAAELQVSEARFRNMADNAPMMVWVTNPTGYCTYLSQSWYDFTGQTEATGLGFGWFDAVHPDDCAAARATFLAANERQEAFQLEYRLHCQDGQYRTCIDAAKPWFGPDGTFKGYIGSVIDIDDRMQAEAALRKREKRLMIATEAAQLGIFEWKMLEDITIWENDRMYELFGLQPTDPSISAQEFFEQYLHPEDAAAFTDTLNQAMQTGSLRQATYRIRRPDGTIRWIEVNGQFEFAEDGSPLRFTGVNADVTARKQAEVEREQLLQQEQAAREAAEQANRIKDEFLAVLSHELRSPLNPILGWTKLLQSGKLDDATTQQALATIERNARLQTELIQDLLDVSRILQGKLSLSVDRVDLGPTIESAIETVMLAADAKAITLQSELDADVGKVAGDSSRLHQIVWNLVSNAVKFTPAGGRVTVRLTRQDNQAQIAVSDTGKGIKPEFLPFVFDYFRQEDGATTRKFGGLGLGLAIVRRLVELHGGTIQASSPGEGQGATFIVRLPLAELGRSQANDQQPSPSVTGDCPLAGVRILVVDDEPDMLDLAAFVLQAAGATLQTANRAEAALGAIAPFQPDVLVSDVGMPDMDGYTLLRQIRQLPPDQGGQIPAIALTAYAAEFDQQQALQSGFQKHLAKPIEPECLVREVVKLLRDSGL